MGQPGSAYDALIIGGGVSGCSTACFLAAQPDFDGSIAVVEKDPTYANAPSARAAGVIRQQFSTPENISMSVFAAEFVENIDRYLSVDGETPDVGFKPHGFLLLSTPETFPVMQANCKVQQQMGVDTLLLTPDALKARFPYMNTDGLAGGSIGSQGDGWLDPYLLLQAYRRKARAAGVTFIEDEVMHTARNGSSAMAIELRHGGVVHAEYVVNTSGARDVTALAAQMGVTLPIEPRKREIFAFDCREQIGRTPHIIFPNGVSVRAETNGYIAASSPPEGWPDEASTSVEPDYALFEEYIWPTMAERIPALEAVKLSTAYCCHYDMNLLDENVIIDKAATDEKYFFAAGFSGHGLQQSPAIGRAMSELVTFGEYRTLDLSRFGFARVIANEPLRETNCF